MLVIAGCASAENKSGITITTEYISIQVPQGFPEIDFPEDNLPTRRRIALGRELFYDNALSRDRTVSCASCHLPEYGFSDTLSISPGEHGALGIRNAPPLHNVAYLPYLFKDGGIPNLELQIKAPVEDPNEMNFNMHEAVLRLVDDPTYQRLAQNAYNRDMDAFVITRSLAAFMRTFISGDSKYDQAERGEVELSEEEMRGKAIFFGDKAKCSECHSGYNFTNNAFENNGSKTVYADTGRARITLNRMDHGKFRVPSLRNIALTAPYMHDGSYQTLESVLSNYQKKGSGHWNQSPVIGNIELEEEDKKAILAFLNTLTDSSFVNNEEYKAVN